MTDTCKTCRFADVTEGRRCRRFPPVPFERAETFGVTILFEWPIVDDTDWCGEYAPAQQGES